MERFLNSFDILIALDRFVALTFMSCFRTLVKFIAAKESSLAMLKAAGIEGCD